MYLLVFEDAMVVFRGANSGVCLHCDGVSPTVMTHHRERDTKPGQLLAFQLLEALSKGKVTGLACVPEAKQVINVSGYLAQLPKCILPHVHVGAGYAVARILLSWGVFTRNFANTTKHSCVSSIHSICYCAVVCPAHHLGVQNFHL